jgi:hypothetical protein
MMIVRFLSSRVMVPSAARMRHWAMKVWSSGLRGIGVSLVEKLKNSFAEESLVSPLGHALLGFGIEVESELGVDVLGQGG